jgi:hypothetical protein
MISIWDVMALPPTDMLSMEVQLYPSDMSRNLFQTKLELVDRVRLETKISHDVRLPSWTPSLALVRRRLNVIKFYVIGWIIIKSTLPGTDRVAAFICPPRDR